ncbi:5'-nucleotidase C-terminal domain-containing protein [Tianweitania sediminis]|uniref:5'-nucleotidase C-terminal domain-containing protein n=1 Tax=Tianweitania sediminis TaxID=1502156 RepID=A0A8J7UHK6_9HYPH|nr:5'-nucleotidase C-terminal domain-containing protein [Tianweitania sediminis]MBP0439294.1 5'-nucleotidase C-terminal domain-containing protein [Tianweitania sediminis]
MKRIALLAALSTSVLSLSAGLSYADYTLNILHINDWHSRIEGNNKYESTCSQEEKDKGECFGGAARLVTAIRQQRESLNGQNVIVLNAGDNYQGSLFFQTYHGDVENEFSNLIDFDAMVVGNHEFDNGEDGVKRLLDQATFPVLGANVDVANGAQLPKDKLLPSTVVEIGGEKIGVIGVVTTDTADIATPGPNISFADDVTAIEAEVNSLTDQGVNKIIALTHVGYVRDRDVLAKIPGVDVVVGGHSHTVLSNDGNAEGPYPTMVDGAEGRDVPVVTAGSYSKYLGNLSVTFDDQGNVTSASGDPILLDNSIPEDPQVLERVAELGGPIEELKAKQVGELTAPADGSRESCRAQECEMGNLIADAILDRTKDQGVTIAIQNGGGIRSSIDGGPVTMGEVLTVLPFQNTVATFQLSGEDLKASLEGAVSAIEEGKGKFPQVAGIRYTLDKSVAPNEGRIKSVEVSESGNWTPLDPAKTYTIVTNNFVRNGGDDYDLFETNAQNAYDYGPSLEQVVAEYISENSPYTPKLENRIIMADAAPTSQPAAAETVPTQNSEQTPAEPTASEPPSAEPTSQPTNTEPTQNSEQTPVEPTASEPPSAEPTSQPTTTTPPASTTPATNEAAPAPAMNPALDANDIDVPEPVAPAPTTPPTNFGTEAPAPSGTSANTQPTQNSEQTPTEPTASEPPSAEPTNQGASTTPTPEASAATMNAPAASEQRRTVRRGDSLWRIAEEVYGDGAKWRVIADANPAVRSGRLAVGMELVIPAAN